MKYLILLFMFFMIGCATSSDHTKRGDEIMKDALVIIEKYFKYDAQGDPMKREYTNQLSEVRKDAQHHAHEDPSLFGDIGGTIEAAAGGYGGLIATVGGILATSGLAWLRGRVKKKSDDIKNEKTENLVNELIKTPDEKECLKKVREAKFA